jgi:hypothetical protein
VKHSLRLVAKLRLDWFKRWQQPESGKVMSSPWGEETGEGGFENKSQRW